MTSPTVVIVLRLFHILSGVFWVGSVVFIARFLAPAVRDAGPGGPGVMQQLTQVRKLPNALIGAAVVTILSGVLLYAIDSGGFQNAWLASRQAMIFGLGGVLGIATLIMGILVNAPVGNRLGEIGAAIKARGGPPTPEEAVQLQQLQARLARAGAVAAALLILATAAMAVARYIP
jgi:uncharacterized membrane protein